MAIWLTKERAQPGPVFGNKSPSIFSLCRIYTHDASFQTNSWVWASSWTRTSISISGIGRVLTSDCSFANARHTFAFPRITSMLGDGKTKYNNDNDGDGQEVGACSVGVRNAFRPPPSYISFIGQFPQNKCCHQTENYICQGHILRCTFSISVSLVAYSPLLNRSRSNTKLVRLSCNFDD